MNENDWPEVMLEGDGDGVRRRDVGDGDVGNLEPDHDGGDPIGVL